MLSVLLACATAVAQTDTAPVVLAGTPSASAAPSPSKNFTADSMVLEKSHRQLTLYYHGQEVRRYGVALGKNPVGDKVRRGDGRTPEGLFFIQGHNPQSKYHLSLRISYPDAAHRLSAERRGVSPGG